MRISYKNPGLERTVVVCNVIAGCLVAGTFVALFGFYRPLADQRILFALQGLLLGYFILEKLIRAVNTASISEI